MEKRQITGMIACLVIFVLAVTLLGLHTPDYEGILRLHILADDDSEQAQALKLLVRDAVVEQYGPVFANQQNADAAKELIREELDKIETLSQQILAQNGCYLPVTAELSCEYFPQRDYEGVIFPQGQYDALRIKIGEAQGQNWWCVLFPPLCFVDTSRAQLAPDRQYVPNKNGIVLRFKLLEWFGLQ